MSILIWINLAFGVLALGYGAVVLRGVLKGTLRSKWPMRFLACSLLASLGGLVPLTRHLGPIQGICMLLVYCCGAAIAAWLRFHLSGFWRPAFAFSVTAVLYLDLVFTSMQLFNHLQISAIALAVHFSAFQVLQFLFAVLFAVLGLLAVKKCHALPTRPL
jgi:hypothetical protein